MSRDLKFKFARALLAISTILSSWLLMQAIHECGHVIGAMLTGANVRRVVLVPWELSRTDIGLNPSPLIVCWSGPLFGAVLPAFVWIVAQILRWRIAYWLRFLTGFCLIANGAYIGVGSLTHDGDGGDLLRDGSPIWTLALFGAVAVPLGFVAWHGLGSHFGIGISASAVSWQKAGTSLLVLTIILAVEVIASIV